MVADNFWSWAISYIRSLKKSRADGEEVSLRKSCLTLPLGCRNHIWPNQMTIRCEIFSLCQNGIYQVSLHFLYCSTVYSVWCPYSYKLVDSKGVWSSFIRRWQQIYCVQGKFIFLPHQSRDIYSQQFGQIQHKPRRSLHSTVYTKWVHVCV